MQLATVGPSRIFKLNPICDLYTIALGRLPLVSLFKLHTIRGKHQGPHCCVVKNSYIMASALGIRITVLQPQKIDQHHLHYHHKSVIITITFPFPLSTRPKMASLPPTMKALVLPTPGASLEVRTIPTPTAVHGSVVIKVLASHLSDKHEHNLAGKIFSFPPNLISGGQAIGRVAETGPDTTSLSPGQLVLLHSFIRGRDDPNGVQVLWGLFDGFAPKTKKWYKDNYSAAAWAEYVRAPLEVVEPLDEKKLHSPVQEGGLGYSMEALLQLTTQLVPMGGFRGINLQPGERIIIAPSTGEFGGASVQVAVAMGAQVIAVGRNIETLKDLQATFPPGRVQVVAVTGDEKADMEALKQWGPIDAYLDIVPSIASGKNHIRACFMALRQYARVSLMGFISDDIAVPYATAVANNLTIRGQWMYERDDVKSAIKMAESGLLRLDKENGTEVVGRFKLEEWREAFEFVKENGGFGKIVAFTP
ncbi:chaperonin 10-like protein [Podospora fimiseda]|uniref:Chaperonin 10-like protein n=1 Tax=Podospora fimiseda TaxID=252190 RepID=A0AAN7BGT9_9PEZI|nr:chaperonin 10-like protein [Podospora fimiseda]